MENNIESKKLKEEQKSDDYNTFMNITRIKEIIVIGWQINT